MLKDVIGLLTTTIVASGVLGCVTALLVYIHTKEDD